MKKVGLFFAFLFVVTIFAGCGNVNLVEATSHNVNNYEISAVLDYENKTINANEKLIYQNKSNMEINVLKFHLYPNAFREGAVNYKAVNKTQFSRAYYNGFSEGGIDITSAKVNNVSVTFEIVGEDLNILEISLNTPLRINDKAEIEIDFHLTIPNINHRFGYGENTLNLGNWYPIVCVLEEDGFDTTGYSPNGDPFYSEIANYIVKFSYPTSLTLAHTGESMEKELDGNMCTNVIQAKAVRDFACVFSQKYQFLTSNVNGIIVNYYYYDDETPEVHLQTCIDAVNTFNEMLGQYSYQVLNVAKTNFLQGGMEYPNLVYIADNIEKDSEYNNVIIHEIAHQWWYAVVGNNQTDEAWIDEGLAEYCTALFYDENPNYNNSSRQVLGTALSSYLLFYDVYREVYGDFDTSMNRNLHNFATETEYVYITYVKSVLMFDAIADVVGEARMKKGMQAFYKDYAMKIATGADLINSFEKATNRKLSSFITSWVDGTVIIEELNG